MPSDIDYIAMTGQITPEVADQIRKEQQESKK